MHQTTGRWKLGLALALITALMWGMLPIALKLLLDQMDAWSISWYRFLVAALILGAIQARRRQLPAVGQLSSVGRRLLAVAALGLTGNYVLYLIGLDYITPSAAQIVIQLAPMLLLLGGLVMFRERFVAVQWLGLAALVTGLTLFFNHRLGEILSGPGAYTVGILLIVCASVTWAAYALAQKQLLREMPSENIMLLVYVAGVVLFLPTANVGSIADLDAFGIGLLAFASLNTLIAYGSFAEALDHWEASRVSTVLAITPLLTLLFMAALGRVSELLTPEPVNLLSLAGAVLVVAGSALTALTRTHQQQLPAAAPRE